MHGLELSDVVASLRENLENAQKHGKGHRLRFGIDDVEVEFQVAITKDAGGKASVKFWVLDAEASGKLSQVVTQKIKLKLKVTDTFTDKPAEMSDEDKK